MDITAARDENDDGNNDQGTHVAGQMLTNTIQPGSFTAAEMPDHTETQTHQRLPVTSLEDRAPTRTQEPQYFCEVCQRSGRQLYLHQHEATYLHQRRLAASLGHPVAPSAPQPAVKPKVPKPQKVHEWTSEEDEMIVRAYIDMKDDKEIMAMLPTRAKQAVMRRRVDLTNPRPTGSGDMDYSGLYLRVMREKNGGLGGKIAQ